MAARTPILATQGLTIEFRGFRALDGVDLRVDAGTIHAVIGTNGAGKTTLFNLLSGLLCPSSGRIVFDGADITGHPPYQIAHLGVARSFQITSVFPHLTLLDNVRLALQVRPPVHQRHSLADAGGARRRAVHHAMGMEP